MDRVFREQATSQKQVVADDVVVRVIPEEGVRLIGLTGLDGAPPSGGASVTLWPMSIEHSLVVLAQLQVGPGGDGPRRIATVQLDYFDLMTRRSVSTEKTISGEMSRDVASYDPTWDLEILRNVTIQNTAEGMRQISHIPIGGHRHGSVPFAQPGSVIAQNHGHMTECGQRDVQCFI